MLKILLVLVKESGISRHPKNFLLLRVDGGFDLRADVVDVHALNHDWNEREMKDCCEVFEGRLVELTRNVLSILRFQFQCVFVHFLRLFG